MFIRVLTRFRQIKNTISLEVVYLITEMSIIRDSCEYITC